MNLFQKYFVIYIFLFLLANTSFAQNDDFKKEFAIAITKLKAFEKEDTNRVNALIAVLKTTDQYYLSEKKIVLPYAEVTLELSKKLQYNIGMCRAYRWMGNYNRSQRKYDNAINYYDSSINIYYRTKQLNLIQFVASAMLLKANIYQQRENYNSALKYYFEGQVLLETINDNDDDYFNFNVANIYTAQKNYDKGYYYIKKNIDINSSLKTIEAYYTLCRDYGVICNILVKQNKILEIKDYLDKWKPLLKDVDSSYTGLYYKSKGNFYFAQQIFDSAFYFYKLTLPFAKKYPHSLYQNEILGYLSKSALKINLLEEAKFYALENLTTASKAKEKQGKIEALQNLSTYYYKMGDSKKAYEYLQENVLINDSLFIENTIKQNNALAAIYETEKIQREAAQIQLELAKKEAFLTLQKTESDAAITKQLFLNKAQQQNILLQNNELLLNKQTLFANQQQFTLLNKDKELQTLAFLKTQGDLETEQLLKGEKEKQLTIVQKEKLLQSSQVKSLSQENELNKLRQRQLLFYGVAGLGTLLFTGLYFFNRNKAKQAQLKLELEKKEAEFQRSLADVSMSALRSQMNPHFIFNCLNSIKLYTTQNDNVAAANYLTKFSKLIRMALENSRSETVTLSAELESLELYIQMEAMRFKEKLKYSITIDKNVDSSFIEIPPMLLQPYVENAIWHGLMHKEEGGRIDVGVQVLPNEHTLAITVKDNGVGREKAAQLKSKTAVAHKSYGTKVTSERLDLINKIYKTGASVDIEDVLENGVIAGTLVTIKIPFE